MQDRPFLLIPITLLFLSGHFLETPFGILRAFSCSVVHLPWGRAGYELHYVFWHILLSCQLETRRIQYVLAPFYGDHRGIEAGL